VSSAGSAGSATGSASAGGPAAATSPMRMQTGNLPADRSTAATGSAEPGTVQRFADATELVLPAPSVQRIGDTSSPVPSGVAEPVESPTVRSESFGEPEQSAPTEGLVIAPLLGAMDGETAHSITGPGATDASSAGAQVPGFDGSTIKVGGYGLTGTAVREGRRVIVVLNGMNSMRQRDEESARLIEWAFREFSNYKLVGAGDKIEDAEVWLGSEPKVALTVDKDFVVTLPRKSRKDMKVTLVYDKPVPAPIKKGDQLGKIVVTVPDAPPKEAPILAAAPVDRVGTVGRMAAVAAYLIWGNKR